MRRAILLIVLLGSILLSGAPAAADSGDPVTTTEIAALEAVPGPATLIFIVNPSKRALNTALDNLVNILRQNTTPDLMVVGIYEQKSADDGPPFDREFISTRSPKAPTRPTLDPDVPRTCSGTRYQKKKCGKAQAKAFAEYKAKLGTWQSQIARNNLAWFTSVTKQIHSLKARHMTEEAPHNKWNIRAALLNAGLILKAEPNPVQCVAMLGGLAVLGPPSAMPISLLRNTTLVAAGWRGTDRVQREWTSALKPLGAKIMFLPSQVTSLSLVDYVGTCLQH